MDHIYKILERGVVEINVKEDLKKRLESGDTLRVKLGIDPTGSDLHLGHTVPLRKLKDFQDAGHQVVLLFGTFTGKIGDPTGKDKLRVPLTDEAIEKNMQTYIHQAAKILDMEKVEIVKNGDWLAPLNFSQILELAGCFTASQMMHRDMFQKRLAEGKDINLVEFFYPLMQGYDSVPIKADVEIGGTDQLFNLMAGRKIQERYDMRPQNIITVPILEGLDGHEKMSKSLNNYVGVLDTPRDMFGKLMGVPDNLMQKYFELLTDYSDLEIDGILDNHPRDAKMRLAHEITKNIHSEQEADHAKEEFIKIFSEREKNAIPDDIPEKNLANNTYSVLELAIQSELFSSNSEARRKVLEGAFKVDGEKQNKIETHMTLENKSIVAQFGKRKFIRLSFS